MLGVDINLVTPTAALSFFAIFGALLVIQGLASAFAGGRRIDGTGPDRSHSLSLRDCGNLVRRSVEHMGRDYIRQRNGRDFHNNLVSFDQNVVNFTRILHARHEQIINRSLLGSSVMTMNGYHKALCTGGL